MERKQTLQYFKAGDLTGLEAYLNAMSEKGWQCVRPGRLRQCFLREDGVWVHRFDYSDAPKGSAEEITHSAALERAEWEVSARRKGWLLCRKSADRAEADEALPGGRDRVRARFKKQIARLESARRILLVIGSLLMIGGYVSDLLPVLYGCAIPLALIIPITYRIKFLSAEAES